MQSAFAHLFGTIFGFLFQTPTMPPSFAFPLPRISTAHQRALPRAHGHPLARPRARPHRNTHPDQPRPAALRPVPPLPVYHKYQVLAPGGYRTQFLSQSSLLAIKIMATGRHGFHKRCFHGVMRIMVGRDLGRGSDSVYYGTRD